MMKISVALISFVVYLIIGKILPINHEPTRTYYSTKAVTQAWISYFYYCHFLPTSPLLSTLSEQRRKLQDLVVIILQKEGK